MYSSFKAAYNDIKDELNTLLNSPDFNAALITKNYEKAYEMTESIEDFLTSNFTALLLDAGIDPLPHMETIVNNMYDNLPITHINIPNNIKSIGSYAFCSCKQLESITIPASVTMIDSAAFAGCKALKSISLPDSLTLISDGVFCRCTFLISIIIPNDVTAIDNDAFWGCRSLTSIIIPSSVKSISERVFCNCTSLNVITYLGTRAEWRKIKKDLTWDMLSGITTIRCSDGDIKLK